MASGIKMTILIFFVPCFFFFFFYRTLSNWVIELDKWAPSIVKIAYKVAIDFYYHYVLLLKIDDIIL